MNHLFGIGFGYYYGGVFKAVLVNTGWIGMIVYLLRVSQTGNIVTIRQWRPWSLK